MAPSQVLRQVLARAGGESQGHGGAGDAPPHQQRGRVQRVQGQIPVHAGEDGGGGLVFMTVMMIQAKNEFGDCGGNISNSENGVIKSPNYPEKYSSNDPSKCQLRMEYKELEVLELNL